MNKDADSVFVDLVEKAAQARGDVMIPREFIEKALIAINSGEVSVEQYTRGCPLLKDVYSVAVALMPK